MPEPDPLERPKYIGEPVFQADHIQERKPSRRIKFRYQIDIVPRIPRATEHVRRAGQLISAFRGSLSKMHQETPSRYAIATEVLDELLPDHEFLGPLFDDKITVLRAKVEAVCSQIRTQLASALESVPKANQATGLWPIYNTLRTDISEMRQLLETLDSQLKAVEAAKRDIADPANISPEDASAEEALREAAETLEFQIGCFQGVEARIGLTIANFGFSNALTTLAVLNQITVLRRLSAILQQAGGEATKDIGPARAILKSLPAPGAEHATEEYGKMLIGDSIAVLLPVTGILTDGFKRWREAKLKPEESIALVKLLIRTREVIHIWETGDLVMRPRNDQDLNAIATEEYRRMVNEIHQQWIEQRPESLIPASTS